VIALAGCGRLGFDSLGTPDGGSGGVVVDAPLDGPQVTCTMSPCFEEIQPTVWLQPDSFEGNFLTIGGVMYFAGSDGVHGVELWRTDGTGAGTRLVKDINPTSDSAPMMMVDLGGTLYFFANDGTTGRELWRSDGTEAGTTLVADFYPGSDGQAFVYKPIVVGSKIVFAANDGTHGVEPCAFDGTTMKVLADLEPGVGSSNPYEMWPLSPTRVILRARTTVLGAELYVSDGTNVTLVADAAPGSADSLPDGWFRYFGVMNGFAYYRGTDGTNGLELWRSDGTKLNTAMVADIQPGAGDGVYGAPWPTTLGSVLAFHGIGPVVGNEPFFTNGTMVTSLDINPTGDSLPVDASYDFTPFMGRVYLRASDGTHGIELWSTDSAQGDLRSEGEINPTGDATPNAFFTFGSKLYFAATDGTRGQQLWTHDGTAVSLAHAFGSTDAWPQPLALLGSIEILGVDDAAGMTHLWRMF
jgi:ELWxxDGT repeat protein